jgi:hypothetical protein
MKTTTKTNTFFGIIAALIAVIFTLTAFTACTQPTETSAPAYQFPTVKEGDRIVLTIENQTSKPNANYKALADKLPTAYAAAKDETLENFIGNGGTVKLVLGISEGSNLQNNILTVILDADTLLSQLESPVIDRTIKNKIVYAVIVQLETQGVAPNISFTKAHIRQC